MISGSFMVSASARICAARSRQCCGSPVTRSPRSKVRYRTLSYCVGTIGTLQEVSCRLFPAAHLELCDEARRIAPNIAKLESLDICHAVNAMPWPELIKRGAALHGSFFFWRTKRLLARRSLGALKRRGFSSEPRDFATRRSVRNTAGTQWHSTTPTSNVAALRQKERIPTRRLCRTWSGTPPRHSVLVRCAAAIWWGIS
jgi:hypothetical protein